MANEKIFGTRTQASAMGADLACVVRLNLFHNDAFHVGFVGDEALQLVEAPVTNPIIHHSPSSFIPYSFEVFQNNLSTIKTFDDAFADVVVNPSHKPLLSATYLPKKAFSRPCAFGLELSPEKPKSSLGLLDNTAIKESCLAGYCEVVYSEVNAQNDTLRATVLLNGINLFRESKYEKASVLLVNSEQALTYFTVEVLFVAVGYFDFELLPAFEQSENKDFSFEVSTAREVVSDRSLLNQRFVLSFLDYSASLFDTSDSELSRKCLFEMFINEWLKFDIVSYLSSPSIINTILQSLGVNFDSSDYFISSSNLDFGTDGCSHNVCKEQGIFKVFGNEEKKQSNSAIPPMTKVNGRPCLTAM